MPLQVRRGPTADRILITPVEGELVVDTTENTLYVGDGVTPGGVAASSFTAEDAQDAAAALLTSGVHSNISFSYNDGANRIDAALNLQNYNGVIEADAFKGSLYSDDSSLLVDGVLGSINLNGTVRSNVIPWANEAYDLGSPTNKFRDLYLSGSSLWIGDAQITASGSAVNLPVGSTVNGTVIGAGSGDGVVEGSNYRINIIGDDSTVIVNSSSGTVNAVGGLTGNLLGNVTGNLSGNVTGGFTGTLNGNLNTGGFGLVSGATIFIAPQTFTQFGSIAANINGNIVIRRSSYSGETLNGAAGFLFQQYHNSTETDRMVFHRSRGSYASPLPLQIGDQIAELAFIGETNAATFNRVSASIRAVAVGGPSEGGSLGDVIPSKIEFRTVNTIETDTASLVAVMTADKRFLVDSIAGLTTGLTIVGDITGSVFSDDSTRIIDGINGSVTAGSFVQFGSLTAAERNNLAAVNGMAIYNTTYNRFEGYQNGSWINLDNGTAVGV